MPPPPLHLLGAEHSLSAALAVMSGYLKPIVGRSLLSSSKGVRESSMHRKAFLGSQCFTLSQAKLTPQTSLPWSTSAPTDKPSAAQDTCLVPFATLSPKTATTLSGLLIIIRIWRKSLYIDVTFQGNENAPRLYWMCFRCSQRLQGRNGQSMFNSYLQIK